jgi:hypothetical protein
MAITADKLTERLHAEIDRVPLDRREALLTIIHAYREAVDDHIDPAESIRRGLEDVRSGRVHPVETLWDGIEEA